MKYLGFSYFFQLIKNRSVFFDHVLTLMSGAVVAQLISVLIAPVLTRIYSPEEFGTFALYMSIVNIFGVIVTGRYQLAIMLPKEDEEAINIVALCVLLGALTFLSLVLFLFFFGDIFHRYLNNPVVDSMVNIFPVAIFFVGVYQIQMSWLNRKQKYKIISLAKINQSGVNAFSSLGLGISGLGGVGLILADFLATIASVIVGFFVIGRSVGHLVKKISLHDIKRVSIKYAAFPAINMLHALSDMAQASAIIFIISTGFGAEILGFYAFGLRILRAPMGIIGNSISQVFYQKLVFIFNDGQSLKPALILMLKKLFAVALVPFIIIFLFSDYFFRIAFGENWSEAGVYVQILCPWLYFNFVASSISQVPMIMGRQKQVFFIGLIGNSIAMLIYAAGAYCKFDIRWVLTIVSMYMTFYTVFVIFWTLRISDEIS